MILSFWKYQAGGNDFIIIDNRHQTVQLSTTAIQRLCHRHFGIGADGLILMENSSVADFKMRYYNRDGKESTMCGNGGRCMVAFAHKLGIIQQHTTFEAIDGRHYAELLQRNYVRLQMQNVLKITQLGSDYVLNTGSPHYVRITKEVSSVHVYEDGRRIRYSEPFCEQGINVNFVQIIDAQHILVRTYERGVENETLSCGTGVTAAAIVVSAIHHQTKNHVFVKTSGGELEVELEYKEGVYQNIFLIGNADMVFKGEIQTR